MAEVMLMSKAGSTVTPVKVKNPENELTAMWKIRDELEAMILRCQGMLLAAAESAPDPEELDAVEDRLEELKEQLETITGV